MQTLPDGTQEETLTTDFVSREVTRGFAVAFRQLYEPGESASFLKAYNAVARQARPQWGDDENWQALAQWRAAHGKLRAKPLKVLSSEKLFPDRGAIGVPGDGPPYPEEIISTYNYGDLIHWGSKRQELSALGRTEFDSAWNQLRFLEAVGGLSHLYIGFGGVVANILAED
ncbi:hypothetical protein GCM10010112_55260 [Actinoplanes lobatus]|uniref:Uncharacterized protein n=1 Tax=Actinoplanes lobatus TaxID=113568 RepID=A0ABQ4AGQ7_9ACTN|nr:hypothetical protein GCM10010112_55260 [Actinoplanes lobatus]GIE40195.1 hypothetical protein Alo02nite_30930 [Actinoplanes lobatus]